MAKFMRRFTLKELTLMAVMAALGVALKPLVVPLANMVSAPLLIPGGAFAGGLYMMWLVMAQALTGRLGAATLAGLTQALMMLITGMPGSHGVLNLITYTLPGLVCDLAALPFYKRPFSRAQSFAGGMAANLMGTVLTNLVFIRPPMLPWMLSLSAAALSGGAGGLLAWQLYKLLRKYHLGGEAADETL